MMIYAASVRWPGRSHDTRVFEGSSLKRIIQGGNKGHVLGDSGYPLREYLMTPIRNARTDAQESYNAAHRTTRNVIERTFGVTKQRYM